MSPRKRSAARADRHKYPLKAGDGRSYLLDKVPSDVLDGALHKARTSGRSLRVVLIDFLHDFVAGRFDVAEPEPEEE